MELGIRFRKFVVTFYRSVRNYPFLFGLLCLLILLYRSCPLLFSLLVSSSPVLICTAVLLGTLLSFGQPNIPEIETETDEKVSQVSRDVAPLRSGILDNDTVVAKEDDSFTVERFDGDLGNSYVERGSEEDRRTRKLDEHADFVDFVPVIHEHDREIQFERGGVEEFEKGEVVESEKGEVEIATTERELQSLELEERREIFERDIDVKSLSMDGENAVENQVTVAQSMRNEIHEVEDRNISIEPFFKGDHLKLSLNDKGDRDVNDYDSSGSESDRAESSSPDASMADIIPLLDELDPLLDSETPLPANRLNEESDVSSEQSHKSDDDCVMSDDEAENQGEDNAAVEQDDDDDDDGMREEKEDESKSAIKWTEDDQKNLMDLGSLEVERNQRLENLIARRRARNNLRMLAGKNLIDLDGFDLPVNVPPISTAKRNPFDVPFDSYNNMGLPPIPGSAPSILLPRRNPFDLPYDPNEEKPDLKSDDFEHEFLPPQHKDIFRRHESFSVGPSNFAVPKPDLHDIRWKPYFMPEKIAVEGTSYSPLERQFSEVSESKLSSVSDTESMSSIADQDDKKLDESHSFLETTTASYLDPTAEHGNGSWEVIGSEDYVEENRDVHHEVIEITLGSTESHFESQSGSSETGVVDIPVEINASEVYSKSLLVETDLSRNSSISSLSEEVREIPFEGKTDEVRPSSPRVEKSSVETTGTPLPAALEEDVDFKIASEVRDDIQHQEPVYDSSPSAEGKDSDVHSEIESNVSSNLKDLHDASSELHVVDKNEQESKEVSEVIVREVTKVESPKHDTNYDAHNLSIAPELVVEHVLVDSGPSFSDIASIDKGIVDDIKENKDRLTSHEQDIIDGIPKIEDGNLESSPSSDQISFQSRTFTEPEDPLSSAVSHVAADIGPPSDAKLIEMHETLNNDDNGELGQTKIYRSISSHSSIMEETILQNDAIIHTDQSEDSISNRGCRGSGIPTQDLDELIEMIDSTVQPEASLSNRGSGIPTQDLDELIETTDSTDQPETSTSNRGCLGSGIPTKDLNELIEMADSIDQPEASISNRGCRGSGIPTLDLDELIEMTDSIDQPETSISNRGSGIPTQDLDELIEMTDSTYQSEASISNRGCRGSGIPIQDLDELIELTDSTDQSEASISNRGCRGSGIPIQDLDDLIEITDSLAASHDHLTTTNATIPTSQEQKDPGAVEEQATSSSATFPSELEQVEEHSMNEKEVGSEQDFVQPSSVKANAESEALQVLDIKVASSGSITPNVTPEAISSVTGLERSWSDNTMVEPVISHSDDAEESAILSTDTAAEAISESITPKVHQDISTALSSVKSDSFSASSDHDLQSSYAVRDPKDGIVDHVVFENREEVSKHLDYLAEAYGSGFFEKMTREEVDEIADIDEGLLSELDEVGDFSVKEIGEPVFEKKVMPEEAQAERFELGSSSNTTDAKSDIPILEARSLDDINLAFRQLHEGVDVEDVILPSAIKSQVKEEAEAETSSDFEVVEARSLEDIHVALMQESENNIDGSGSSSKPTETQLDIPVLEARSLDDIDLAFRQLHEGVDVEDFILPSAIKSKVNEEARLETSSDLEIVEARSLGDIQAALMQDSEKSIGESGSSSKPTETKSDIPILEARSLDDINLAFKQLDEGVDVDDIILPSSIESQVKEEAKPKTGSDLAVVEARSLRDIHVALAQASENNIDESGSSSILTETKSDITVLEAKSLDDINLAFRQLDEGVDVEDIILPSAFESQAREEAKPETSSDFEVVEARSLGDLHVALMQHSENNKDESGSTSNPTETESDIPVLETRSLDDISLAFRQLHEGVDVEDVILPSAVENQAKAETSSDLEVVEAKSLGDIHDALTQVKEKNLSELPENSVSNETSKEELEPARVDSITAVAPSNTTDANAVKPVADIIDTKSVDPNVSASETKDDVDKPAADEKSVDPNVSTT